MKDVMGGDDYFWHATSVYSLSTHLSLVDQVGARRGVDKGGVMQRGRCCAYYLYNFIQITINCYKF